MTAEGRTRAEQAQLAMMLEVTAFPKPGNVDRCHDFGDTTLEHFLASVILVRPAFERAQSPGANVGDVILDAVTRTNVHSGGNTHFGAFILLVPLITGGDIPGAICVVQKTTVEDAINFYHAFGMTEVRVLSSDELDIHNPEITAILKSRNMTLYDVMKHSAGNDMVAREWVNGFAKTRCGADLLKRHGHGRDSIIKTFLELLALEPDTFIAKKHGSAVAEAVRKKAQDVCTGTRNLAEFDQECIDSGINPGSTADIIIASIYVALGEGWQWD
jgi:triphosphoribosyl-dephospho-CoA synthase